MYNLYFRVTKFPTFAEIRAYGYDGEFSKLTDSNIEDFFESFEDDIGSVKYISPIIPKAKSKISISVVDGGDLTTITLLEKEPELFLWANEEGDLQFECELLLGGQLLYELRWFVEKMNG